MSRRRPGSLPGIRRGAEPTGRSLGRGAAGAARSSGIYLQALGSEVSRVAVRQAPDANGVRHSSGLKDTVVATHATCR
jgi:hypothetical protein